ncbi:hypothetical protein NDU88_000921 [Pleurodeles waltl]|uniref:Uncharacterized protein n=1 Tax=Pleurodeles waltl TaxID=8319 RepID=A0AAV7VYX6_PLEWA|nr:hypothetical protein NDU88_000921 [Pleurodeles waltl]
MALSGTGLLMRPLSVPQGDSPTIKVPTIPLSVPREDGKEQQGKPAHRMEATTLLTQGPPSKQEPPCYAGPQCTMSPLALGPKSCAPARLHVPLLQSGRETGGRLKSTGEASRCLVFSFRGKGRGRSVCPLETGTSLSLARPHPVLVRKPFSSPPSPRR